MTPAMETAGERGLGELFAALHELAGAPRDASARRRLETLLEALFALAAPRGRRALSELEALLSAHEERLPEARPWLALTRLSLARKREHAPALAALDATLHEAPERARWLVAAEAGRLVWRREGPARAFERIAGAEIVSAAQGFQNDNPLVVSAVLTSLSLAAAVGAWDAHDRVAAQVKLLWPEEHPSAVRVGLALADHAIARGNFREALQRLEAIEGAACGDLCMHLHCARLHALVGSGQGESRLARATYRAYRKSLRAERRPGCDLPSDERRALCERAAQIARAAGIRRSARARATSTLARLLEREREARRMKDPARRERALLRVIRRAEAFLLRSEAMTNPEELIRSKLLWCRLVVELGDPELFDTCERILGQALAAAERIDLAPLKMLALDQRAILRARKSPPDWTGAVTDSTKAAALALELLAQNADPSAKSGSARALLASLLPIIDRVLDLHVEGALRIAARHGALLTEPLGGLDELLDEETPRGSFLRFGRLLHTFVEQSQALALAEARNAFGDGRTAPHRFAVAAQGEARIVVDSFSAKLRPEDAVLQYFVFGRYVLVFAYGQSFFDWFVSVVAEPDGSPRPEPAHRRLEELLRALRGWTQGERHIEDEAALGELHALLFPAKIDAALSIAGARHLRIVPHDVLYRVPFGRLSTSRGPLLARFSTSLHPTGQLAAEGAATRSVSKARRPVLGFFFGPEVDCVNAEESAIRRGAGAVLPLAQVEPVDGRAVRLGALLERAPSFELLHFLCHGEEGGGFGRSPSLLLGGGEGERLALPRVLQLPLGRAALVVLQSCWTGWMDHRRQNPVQGFPQAFCDAGAGAVIAPLTKIPEVLAPLFSEILYRTLRFLPAERALARTLTVLRAHGAALVEKNPEAKKALEEHGSMDAFEYRYVGATGLAFGSVVSRFLGRLSFWWWERGFRRRGA